MLPAGEVIEGVLLFAGAFEPVRGAGFFFEPADDLEFAVGFEIGGAAAVHLRVGGDGAAFALGLGGGFEAVGGEILGFDGGAKTFAAAAEEFALEGGRARFGDGVFFLGGDVGVDRCTKSLAGAQFLAVHFRSGAASVQSVIAGQVALTAEATPIVAEHIRA
eukprot:gene11307-13824_t